MVSLLITLVMLTVVGFVVGVGVMLTNDHPKIGEFIKTRPVIGWTAAFLAGGIVVSVITYLLEVAALAVIGLMLK